MVSKIMLNFYMGKCMEGGTERFSLVPTLPWYTSIHTQMWKWKKYHRPFPPYVWWDGTFSLNKFGRGKRQERCFWGLWASSKWLIWLLTWKYFEFRVTLMPMENWLSWLLIPHTPPGGGISCCHEKIIACSTKIIMI